MSIINLNIQIIDRTLDTPDISQGYVRWYRLTGMFKMLQFFVSDTINKGRTGGRQVSG
jgi:hypothetical protein